MSELPRINGWYVLVVSSGSISSECQRSQIISITDEANAERNRRATMKRFSARRTFKRKTQLSIQRNDSWFHSRCSHSFFPFAAALCSPFQDLKINLASECGCCSLHASSSLHAPLHASANNTRELESARQQKTSLSWRLERKKTALDSLYESIKARREKEIWNRAEKLLHGLSIVKLRCRLRAESFRWFFCCSSFRKNKKQREQMAASE